MGAPLRPRGRRRAPDWQRRSLRTLEWGGFAAVSGALIGGALLDRLSDTVSPLTLIVPLSVGLIMFIPAAYHRGLRDGREHPNDNDDADKQI